MTTSENLYPFAVTVSSTKASSTRVFALQIDAERYIRRAERMQSFKVQEFNFTKQHSEEEMNARDSEIQSATLDAKKRQTACLEKTRENYRHPGVNPCEICGKPHENYSCCSACNYGSHTCKACGDSLGHEEISSCYILSEKGMLDA